MLMTGAIFAFSSCSNNAEEVIEIESTEQTVSITVGLSTDVQTKAAFSETTTLEDLRLMLMISYNGVIVDTAEAEGWDGTSKSFDLTLVTGQTYSVAAWADFGGEYYSLTGVGAAPVASMVDPSAVVGGDMKCDAFFAISDVMFDSTSTSLSLTLKRPFGLIWIETEDLEVESLKNAGLTPDNFVGTFSVPSTLDLLTGAVGSDVAVITAGDCNGAELSYDYIFANDEASVIDFSYTYSSGETVVSTYDFVNIPVRRNYITKITGNILTKEGEVDVIVDQDWDGSFDEEI